jgi:Cellulase (glycosyl hydrolase family 5)
LTRCRTSKRIAQLTVVLATLVVSTTLASVLPLKRGDQARPRHPLPATSSREPSRSSTRCMPWLAASGRNVVIAGTSRAIVLHGVNVMESEWRNNLKWESKALPVLSARQANIHSSSQAITSSSGVWHGNVVVHGFASAPINDGDERYLSLIDRYVSMTRANREYLILSWRSHAKNGDQPGYPDAGAQRSLTTLAARYRGDSHVMFSLQVEPHHVTWSFVQPIFERIVDAVRKAAAPYQPIVFVPGVNWGKDISGAIDAPVRRANIVYTSHPYTSSRHFARYFGSAHDAGLPVFIGEFGPTPSMSMADVRYLLHYTRQRGIGWAAWGYEYDANPSLIDASLKPTNPFGSAVRSAMLGTPVVSRC